jgi:hypothetical protein
MQSNLISNMVSNQIYRLVVFLVLYYLFGLVSRFLLLSSHKSKWEEQIFNFLLIISPQLLKLFLLSLLGGLLFIWIPTLLGIMPESIVSKFLSFVSTFSFSVLFSVVQGWLLIKGFYVIGKNNLSIEKEQIKNKKQLNSTQSLIYFIGFIFILSVFFDFLLSFFIPLLTT